MSDLTDYILAKQTLAQHDVPLFNDSRMNAADIMDADSVYTNRGGPSTFALLSTTYGPPDLDATAVIPLSVRSIGSAELCLKFIQALQGSHIFGTLSDSQQSSKRDQRARDIRAVNMQAQVPLARVYDFEKPFPEERSYSPRLPETPRILKLRK